MEPQDETRASLFGALEAAGWVWENERLYAPNKTFWIEGAGRQTRPVSTLISMHEKMKATLEKLRENKPAHLDTQGYKDWVSDVESVVGILNRLVRENQSA